MWLNLIRPLIMETLAKKSIFKCFLNNIWLVMSLIERHCRWISIIDIRLNIQKWILKTVLSRSVRDHVPISTHFIIKSLHNSMFDTDSSCTVYHSQIKCLTFTKYSVFNITLIQKNVFSLQTAFTIDQYFKHTHHCWQCTSLGCCIILV